LVSAYGIAGVEGAVSGVGVFWRRRDANGSTGGVVMVVGVESDPDRIHGTPAARPIKAIAANETTRGDTPPLDGPAAATGAAGFSG
jgi:hypothetical protein